MSRDFGDRENTRVRDLVDLVMLIEQDLLIAPTVAAAATQVWAERDGVEPPDALPPLPESWSDRYVRLAIEHELDPRSFPAAVARVGGLERCDGEAWRGCAISGDTAQHRGVAASGSVRAGG